MTRSLTVLTGMLVVASCGGATQSMTTTTTPSGASADVRPANAVWPDEESPLKWAPRPTETAITANDLRTRLYQIADDSMMGRAIGSLGNHKTTAYIAREFERLGLKPGGDNGSWFQEMDWGPSSFDSTQTRLGVAGAAFTPRTDWAPITPSAANRFTGSASLQNAPVVFAGRWGDTTTVIDAAMLRGKVAVFTAPVAQQGGGGRGGQQSFVTVRDSRALQAGAAAVLVVALDATPALGTNVFNVRTGMRTSVPSGIPAAAITAATAARIFGRPVEQLTPGTTGQPIAGGWNYASHPVQYVPRNVIAILPGSDPARATQYVLIGAHNDHVGVNRVVVDHDSLRAFNRVMRPQGANDRPPPPTAEQQQQINALIAHARSIRPTRRDSIMNGADDDGSGTVLLLEIAERFAREKPARSIIFISHQGEEGGLLGSRWFVDHPTVPLDSIVAAHNMDMVGKGRVTDVKYGGPNSVQTLGSRRLSRQFGEILDSVNAITAEPMAIDRSWDVPANPLNRFCRSDQVNYVRANIPVTYFSFGYSIDYHMQSDEPQYVDYPHTARLGRYLYDVMTAIANRRDRPAIAGHDPDYPTC